MHSRKLLVTSGGILPRVLKIPPIFILNDTRKVDLTTLADRNFQDRTIRMENNISRFAESSSKFRGFGARVYVGTVPKWVF